MFLVNTLKCLKIFDEVYVSSDSEKILKQAEAVGAIPIYRGIQLCGDVPNITVYKHAQGKMEAGIIVAVQANSPTINANLISITKKLMELGIPEIMTCHKDYSIYGSIWALSAERLENYKDPYNPQPEILIVDNSIDVHTQEDYNLAIKQYESR